MFVSKKKYELVLVRYEQAASRADLAERQLAELYGMALKNGGLCRCILECREAAMAVLQPGCESAYLTADRLAFIDRRLSDLLPLMTKRIPDRERQMWNDALKSRSVEMAYGRAYSLPEEDPV